MPETGKVIHVQDMSKKAHELHVAELLNKKYGGEIIIRKETNKRKIKTSDFFWRGQSWELKGVSTSESSIDGQLRKALQQVKTFGGVILDFGNEEIELAEVERIVDKRIFRADYLGKISTDVMIISRDQVLKITHYKA